MACGDSFEREATESDGIDFVGLLLSLRNYITFDYEPDYSISQSLLVVQYIVLTASHGRIIHVAGTQSFTTTMYEAIETKSAGAQARV